MQWTGNLLCSQDDLYMKFSAAPQLIVVAGLVSSALADKTPVIPLPDAVKHNWGAYTPFFSLSEYFVPDGCSVNQVSLHTSR